MVKRFRTLLMVLFPVLIVSGCFLYPPEIIYQSYLVSRQVEAPAYSYDSEKITIYDLGGSDIIVEYMTDQELNDRWPLTSRSGIYSTNPYTYGDWVNPDVGYTPNRFTVFKVTIINRTFARMMMDPREAVLITDQGEVLHSYTYSAAATRYGNSFETYYRSLRGQSGNEAFRYQMRMGDVRGSIYGLNEMIFRGNAYEGYIVFDPLRPEVKNVRLVLNDVAYRFDAFNRPSDLQTIEFDFERRIDRTVITREMRQAALEKERVSIRMTGPQQVVDNRVNDSARNERAIDRALADTVPDLERAYLQLHRRGEIEEGNMLISFTIDIDGGVTQSNVIEIEGINSERFMNNVIEIAKTMRFDPIEDMPLDGTHIVRGPARAVNVLYPLEFSVYSEE